MLDVAYVVREGDDNEELRYSLRSVAANLPHRNVVIAGHKPAWVTNVHHLPTVQDATKHENALTNLRAILNCPHLTPTVAIFNDDMMVTEPLHQLPRLHCGPLEDAAKSREGSPLEQAYQDTADILAWLGNTHPYSFDLHTPVAVNRAALTRTLDVIAMFGHWQQWDQARVSRVMWKTIHFNATRVRGRYSPNVKVIDLHPMDWPAPFLSTIDLAFNYGAVGDHVRGLFPDPCRYEETT